MIQYTELKNTERKNLRDIIPLKKPFTLLIEPSSVCNFRCKMCFQNAAEEKFDPRRNIMTLDMFQKVIDQAKQWDGDKFRVLKLCIYGEPFINKDFTKMVGIAKKADIADRIETTSNASLLNPDVSRLLVESGLDYLRVSIYSAIPAEHERITGSKISMQQVYDNLRALKEIKKEMSSHTPFVAAKMLDTFDDSENSLFIETYKTVADEVYIDEPHNWVEIGNEDFIGRLYGEKRNEIKLSVNQGRKVCPMPFTTLAVRSDGSVSPCCNDWYGGTNVGSIFEETLEEIWNGKPMYEFLRMQLEERNHENVSCRGCSVYKSSYYARDDIDGLPVSQLGKWVGDK